MKKILIILEVIAAQTMAETRGTSVNLSFANTPSDFDEMLFGIHVIETVFTRSPGFRVSAKNLQIFNTDVRQCSGNMPVLSPSGFCSVKMVVYSRILFPKNVRMT